MRAVAKDGGELGEVGTGLPPTMFSIASGESKFDYRINFVNLKIKNLRINE
jgi:hypothetical protein